VVFLFDQQLDEQNCCRIIIQIEVHR
jgi:hypothetical protein